MNPSYEKPYDLDSTVFQAFPLVVLCEELMKEDAYTKHGKTAHTLARGANMTTVLTVIREGVTIAEHRAPGPATVVVLSGKVTLNSGDGDAANLDEGTAASFSADVPHSITARETSALLVVIGGRT